MSESNQKKSNSPSNNHSVSEKLSSLSRHPMNFSNYTDKTIKQLETELKTGSNGLTENEARERLKQSGPNELKEKSTAWLTILLRQLRSSFVYLLLAAAFVAVLLGEMVNAIMIILFVLINTFLGFYQEYHSEKTVKLLRRFTVRTARVYRDNKEISIPVHELVPGDQVILEAGDIIPADIRIIDENDLLIDESILTGESVSVRKHASPSQDKISEIYQANNIVFSGTTIISGWAKGIVIATGSATVLGELAHLTTETARESTFEKGLNRLSHFIIQLTIITLIIVFLANVIIKGSNSNIGSLAIFAIALAVSVIPEALPVVTMFSLSRGALRLAKNQVVVKRLSAIEDLGSVEVLCTDKTGTLTKNELNVVNIFSDKPDKAIFWAALAGSDFDQYHSRQPNNAFDLAIWQRVSPEDKKLIKEYKRVEEIPFDPERRRNSQLVEHQGRYTLIVRGAPERIKDFIKFQSNEQKKQLTDWLIKEGHQGHRVIAVAIKQFSGPKHYDVNEEKDDLCLAGLISFTDQIKLSAFAAVKKSRRLGVKIKVLTGDSPEVAGNVAHQIGLIKNPNEVITGQELIKLTTTDQLKIVNQKSVFARVSPQQKYLIVQLLQQKNEVGFLGEGINDAPALKISNVGVVVQGAADISREAADIVLLKPSLEVIIDGIKEGREVFSNTIKYLKATLASNFGNFYAIAVATLLIDFLPMLPLQILLLNLLSDFPMIAVATDTTEAGELKRPRGYDVKEIVLIATILGIVSSAFDFLFFGIFSHQGPEILHTYWFIGSILTELVLIFSIRTHLLSFRAKRPSLPLTSLTLLAAALTLLVPILPWSRELFQFIKPEPRYLIIVLGIVIAYFIVTEIVKLFYYRFLMQNHSHRLNIKKATP